MIELANLGHGPLWLGYVLDALLPCVDQVTVTYPDLDAYKVLDWSRWLDTERLARRPLPWQDGKHAWKTMLTGADRLGADMTLLTYLDTMLKKAADVDLDRLVGSPVWGLWFRPGPRQPISPWNLRRLLSRRDRNQYREQQVLRGPPRWLAGAWLTDPLLLERISPRPGQVLSLLPDPWPSRPTMDAGEARRRLGLPLDKTLFLHLGVPDPRKGLLDAIHAWRDLADLPAAMLVRAGVMAPDQADAMRPLVHDGRAIARAGRIPDDDMDVYLRATDWLLMPYRNHEGSSGLLAGAAAAARPVVTADYGVVGRLTKDSGLGIVYPHLSLPGLTDAIRRATATRNRRLRASPAALRR